MLSLLLSITLSFTTLLQAPAYGSTPVECENLLTNHGQAYIHLLQHWLKNSTSPLTPFEITRLTTDPNPQNPILNAHSSSELSYKKGFETILARLNPSSWPAIQQRMLLLFEQEQQHLQSSAEAQEKTNYTLQAYPHLEFRLTGPEEKFHSMFVDEERIFFLTWDSELVFTVYVLTTGGQLQKLAQKKLHYKPSRRPATWVKARESYFIAVTFEDHNNTLMVLELDRMNRLTTATTQGSLAFEDGPHPWIQSGNSLFYPYVSRYQINKHKSRMLEISPYGNLRRVIKLSPEVDTFYSPSFIELHDRHLLGVVVDIDAAQRFHIYELDQSGTFHFKQELPIPASQYARKAIWHEFDGKVYLTYIDETTLQVFEGNSDNPFHQIATLEMESEISSKIFWGENSQGPFLALGNRSKELVIFTKNENNRFSEKRVPLPYSSGKHLIHLQGNQESFVATTHSLSRKTSLLYSTREGAFVQFDELPIGQDDNSHLSWLPNSEDPTLVYLNQDLARFYKMRKAISKSAPPHRKDQ